MHFPSKWFSFHCTPMGYKYMEKHSCNFFSLTVQAFRNSAGPMGRVFLIPREKSFKPIYNCILMERNSFLTDFKRVHLKIKWNLISSLFFFTDINQTGRNGICLGEKYLFVLSLMPHCSVSE